MFRGISMGMSLHLSHLFYADDAIFTGHWSDLNIDTIVQVLECFYRAPGVAKVLPRMESIRCYFFNGVDHNGKKPIWVKWSKVLASKEKGGLVKVSHENVGYSLHQIPRGGIEQVHFLEFTTASIECDDLLVDIREGGFGL
ncbi:hypothetical protein Tco_0282353 [Tanacetum coccineum]